MDTSCSFHKPVGGVLVHNVNQTSITAITHHKATARNPQQAA